MSVVIIIVMSSKHFFLLNEFKTIIHQIRCSKELRSKKKVQKNYNIMFDHLNFNKYENKTLRKEL